MALSKNYYNTVQSSNVPGAATPHPGITGTIAGAGNYSAAGTADGISAVLLVAILIGVFVLLHVE